MSCRRSAWALGLLLALGSSGCVARRDPVAVRWLTHDCTVGERGKLETELRSAGKAAIRTLREASQEGPPKGAVDELAEEAGRQYDEVIEALDAGRTYGLDEDEIAGFRAISREEFIRGEVENFTTAFNSVANVGLIVISSPSRGERARRAGDTDAPP